MVISDQRLKQVKKRTMWISGRKTLLAEGIANAKALRQDQQLRAKYGQNKRPGKEGSQRSNDPGSQDLATILRTFYSE